MVRGVPQATKAQPLLFCYLSMLVDVKGLESTAVLDIVTL